MSSDASAAWTTIASGPIAAQDEGSEEEREEHQSDRSELDQRAKCQAVRAIPFEVHHDMTSDARTASCVYATEKFA